MSASESFLSIDEIPSLGDLLRHRAQVKPDHPFVTVSDHSYSFAELDKKVDAVAAGLHALGVRRGDRVAWLSTNRPEVVELFFALARLGAIQVPLNAFLKGTFLSYQLRQSQASMLITDRPGADALVSVLEDVPELRHCVSMDAPSEAASEALGERVVRWADVDRTGDRPPRVELAPIDTASIMFTSGTTGSAKGCVLSHGYYKRAALTFGRGLGLDEDDTIYTSLPIFHMAAQASTLLSALVFGISSVIDPIFSARTFMARAAEVGATAWVGIGAMGGALLATSPGPADRAHSLEKMVIIPGSPQVQEAFEERFAIDVWSEMYGQTECTTISCTPRLSEDRDRAGCGAATDDLDLALLDDDDRPVPDGEVGEIAIRPKGPFAMFDGYWNMPEETLTAFRNLWYHTGDCARKLPSGQIAFVDRKKDAMRRRGENISSMEVEAAIVRHPKIADVAVHAVPSPLSEDDVKACIVLVEGETITPEELFGFFRDQLPFYAVPRYVDFLDELPRNAMGRVMKFQLRERPTDNSGWDFESLGLLIEASERRTTPART